MQYIFNDLKYLSQLSPLNKVYKFEQEDAGGFVGKFVGKFVWNEPIVGTQTLDPIGKLWQFKFGFRLNNVW